MNFISRYSTFSKGFYLVILGLTIPFYVILYGASGHQFNAKAEDIGWMAAVVTAFMSLIFYLTRQDKTGLLYNLLRGLVTLTLVLMAYGGLKVFIFMVQFDQGDDMDFIVRGLSMIIPAIFTFSAVIILLELYLKETK